MAHYGEGQSITWLEGKWQAGNVPFLGTMDHAPWLGSLVFDGARAFEGVMPDLDLHCQRVVASARAMGLEPPVTAAEIEAILREGVAQFAPGTELYLRPMIWAAGGGVDPDPASTRFAAVVYHSLLPRPEAGGAITVSPFRRPSPEYAITGAKAAGHYPNSGRAVREARGRGFDNAVMLDPLGHVAELATSNIWMVKDGIAMTPVPNGCFLNGITRQRVIALLRGAGQLVEEKTLRWADFLAADEIFTTGNFAKVTPITRIEQRHLQPGPVYARARQLYWDYAHGRFGM